MKNKPVPASELKNISFPACSYGCMAIEYLLAGECESVCPDKFDYKILFIKHMTDQGIPEDHATIEYDAHMETVDKDDLTTPQDDADECMSYWQE